MAETKKKNLTYVPERKTQKHKMNPSNEGQMRQPDLSKREKKSPLLEMGLKMMQDKAVKAKGGKWIKDAIKKPGALREALGAKKGQPIPAKKLASAAKKPGKMGQRARLAQTLRKMNRG